MPKTKLRAAVVGGGSTDAIEAQFYDALQTGDIEKFMACWADEDDVVCICPRHSRVVGTGSIRALFEVLFKGSQHVVRLEHLCKVESLTSAMHNVIQRTTRTGADGVQEEVLIATNVYQRTPQGWRMVAHHCSHGTAESSVRIQYNTTQVLH